MSPVRRRLMALGLRWGALVVLAASAGCLTSSGPSGAVTPGTLRVQVTTGGVDPDPDGYVVSVHSTRSSPVAATDVVEFVDLPPGLYSLTFTGVATNCVVQGGADRSVLVPAGNLVEVEVLVECFALSSGSVSLLQSSFHLR